MPPAWLLSPPESTGLFHAKPGESRRFTGFGPSSDLPTSVGGDLVWS